MAPLPLLKELALDSNFLFDLAREEDFAHSLLENGNKVGLRFRMPPTVVQELAYKTADIHETGVVRTLARKALGLARVWKILPFDLISAGHGITEEFARHLMRLGLLPPAEMNDGLIVAEVALARIPGLVTSDRHLLSIPTADLHSALQDRGLDPIEICHPRRLAALISGLP